MEHNIQQTSKYNTIRYRWACVSIYYTRVCPFTLVVGVYLDDLSMPSSDNVVSMEFFVCIYLEWCISGLFLCWHGIHVMIPRKNMRPFDENPCIHNWRHLNECLFVGEGINIQFKYFNLNEYYLVIHDCLLLWRQFMRKKWHGIHVKTYRVC